MESRLTAGIKALIAESRDLPLRVQIAQLKAASDEINGALAEAELEDDRRNTDEDDGYPYASPF